MTDRLIAALARTTEQPSPFVSPRLRADDAPRPGSDGFIDWLRSTYHPGDRERVSLHRAHGEALRSAPGPTLDDVLGDSTAFARDVEPFVAACSVCAERPGVHAVTFHGAALVVCDVCPETWTPIARAVEAARAADVGSANTTTPSGRP